MNVSTHINTYSYYFIVIIRVKVKRLGKSSTFTSRGYQHSYVFEIMSVIRINFCLLTDKTTYVFGWPISSFVNLFIVLERSKPAARKCAEQRRVPFGVGRISRSRTVVNPLLLVRWSALRKVNMRNALDLNVIT